ncbi:MAG: histidinol-phosphatase HisJ family protein [archaeon]
MSNTARRLSDYHVHSVHSIDGRSTVDEMCSRAIEVGLAEIGFCEHVEFEPEDPGLGFLNYNRYSEAIDQARSKYEGDLTIRKGVELDYNYAYETRIKEWLADKKFDFLTGSVHYVDHIAFDLNRNLNVNAEVVIQKYYSKVRQAAGSGLFDVIAHFDFIRDYVPSNHDPLSIASDEIDLAFEEMITNRTYLEINSRRRADREPFPTRKLILRYLDKGGERFSFGSDAHSAHRVGTGIKQAVELLHSLKPRKMQTLFQ